MTWPPKDAARDRLRADLIAKHGVDKVGQLTKSRRGTPELDLQCQVAGFLRVATVAPARFWFVPNGANISKAQRGRFKDAGLTAGVADLHFMWRTFPPQQPEWIGSFGPMYGVIEMKAGRGFLSPEQEQFRDDVIACGHHWAECRSLEDIVRHLRAWGYPLRAKL